MFKKILTVIITSITLCGCQSTPISSSSSEDSSISEPLHIHTFEDNYSSDDTYHFKKSTCGHDVVKDKGEHIFTDWIVTKEADYGVDGEKYIECSICNHRIYEIIPAKVELELPIFRIETVDHTPITSKEEYVEGTLDIENADQYNDSDLALGIRGRGNYSWSGTEKKSYRIKFDKKYQPLGQGKGKAKSWTLLANHCDKSLLRNDATFYFASKLDNIPFISSSSFVELYLNGSYDGIYELCDQIQVNSNRVDIDDSGEEEDIGYLVELDKNASEDVIYSNLESFEVKSDYVNQGQLDFISKYLCDCEDAIMYGSKEDIETLIDIPSAVDCYLVEEIFKNLDVGWGSFYYTKPKGDKLYFGPVWDFDLSSGNALSDNNDSRFTSYKYTYVGNSYFSYMQQHSWYTYLREYDWFNEVVKERWEEVKVYVLETIDHINETAKSHKSCFEKNFERWPIFNQKINREPAAVMKIKTYIGQVEYLTTWLNNRYEWLDGYYEGTNTDLH